MMKVHLKILLLVICKYYLRNKDKIMSETKESSKSLLVQILEKGADFLKKPFVVKRVTRAFDSAADSLEEKLMDNEAQLTKARENLVDAGKNDGSLTSYMNRLIELQSERIQIEQTAIALKAEREAFLGK